MYFNHVTRNSLKCTAFEIELEVVVVDFVEGGKPENPGTPSEQQQ